MKSVLITGGAGYIGSHMTLALLNRGVRVIVMDNLVNSSQVSLLRVEAITGKKITFYQGDVRQQEDIEEVFRENGIESVIHMAGLKSVSESVHSPCRYYQNNVTGTLNLLAVMQKQKVKKLIFSSSATVYGLPDEIPVKESCPCGGTTNPYGTTKLVAEQFLHEVVNAEPEIAITVLRYFNPAGAHESGCIGEDPAGIPDNLMPYIFQVGMGRLPCLSVYGSDYPTADGTGVRDYIHVMDLVEGHIRALDNIKPGFQAFNLGTGRGYSVFDIIKSFEKVSGKKIPVEIKPRREGDIAECLSDPSLAYEQLGWRAERSLEVMIRDAWHWHKKNPDGYLNC